MKLLTILLLNIFIIVNVYSQDTIGNIKKKLAVMEDRYATEKKLDHFKYSWLLYLTNEKANITKADSILNHIISQQDVNPESITYGQWGWQNPGGKEIAGPGDIPWYVDFNRALFTAEKMLIKLWDQQDKMSKETQKCFISSCKLLTEAAIRRWDTEIFDIGRDYVNYSNIFVMYIETLTLAGERFNNNRFKKMAKNQWTRWYNHVTYLGIDEFASPTYNNVVFKHLKNIHDFTPNERVKRESREIMDHVYLLQSAITHPTLKIPITGISRDYRNFLIEDDVRSEVLTSKFKDYVPPQKALTINENRTYPFEVIGKAATAPFIFKSYQLKDAGMGSMTGGLVFWQQINCMVAVGKNESERAVAFAQGSNTPINGYTDQIETSTLLVFNRLPTYWHLTQWREDLKTYKETFDELGIGISQNWEVKKNSDDHIVLSAYDYDLHIFPFIIENEKLTPTKLELKHRITSSERYHPRDRRFDEYIFPQEPEWFGAYISLLKSGDEIENPKITYSNDDGIRIFKTNAGHKVSLFVTEKGETKQLHNVNPALIPLLEIIE